MRTKRKKRTDGEALLLQVKIMVWLLKFLLYSIFPLTIALFSWGFYMAHEKNKPDYLKQRQSKVELRQKALKQ